MTDQLEKTLVNLIDTEYLPSYAAVANMYLPVLVHDVISFVDHKLHPPVSVDSLMHTPAVGRCRL